MKYSELGGDLLQTTKDAIDNKQLHANGALVGHPNEPVCCIMTKKHLDPPIVMTNRMADVNCIECLEWLHA